MQQIGILEWFLKDHVTLKTGVVMLKIQFCGHRNKLHFKIEKLFLNCHYYSFYCIFDQINTAFLSILRDFFQKHEILATQTFEQKCISFLWGRTIEYP